MTKRHSCVALCICMCMYEMVRADDNPLYWRSAPRHRSYSETESPIPIFIITKDRLFSLKELMRSCVESIWTPYEFVIHDDNSTFPATVNFLNHLASKGVRVYFHQAQKATNTDIIINRVQNTIKNHMSQTRAQFYIVTDPDISIQPCFGGKMLVVFQDLLTANKHLDVVALSMRMDDVTPYSAETFERHPDSWSSTLKGIRYNHTMVYYVEFPVGATFGMYRRNYMFMHGNGYSANSSWRIVFPCSSRHVDFYLTASSAPPDLKYYVNDQKKSGKSVTHSHLILQHNE